MKYGVIVLIICTLGFISPQKEPEVFLIPNKGIGNIVVGESTLKDVQNEMGAKKVQKKWHKSVEFEFFGRFEYFLRYENVATFSTLTRDRNRKVIMEITLDSTSTCKTKNGFGIGSSYKETIQKLGRVRYSFSTTTERDEHLKLMYDNMEVLFDGADSLVSKVDRIQIWE